VRRGEGAQAADREASSCNAVQLPRFLVYFFAFKVKVVDSAPPPTVIGFSQINDKINFNNFIEIGRSLNSLLFTPCHM